MEEKNEFVLSLYTYIENVYTYDAPVEDFARIAGEEISPQAAEDIMTIAEQLIHRGMEEGKLEANLASAKKMIKEGVDPQFIAKFTELSLAQIKKLQQHEK